VGQLFVGVFAPSATPRPVVEQIAAANKTVMADPAFQKILIDSGLEPISDTPDRARAYIAEETARWAPVVKATGLVK
jgi:tripartite-type tricarboxylate transporter receptor subunit TctC